MKQLLILTAWSCYFHKTRKKLGKQTNDTNLKGNKIALEIEIQIRDSTVAWKIEMHAFKKSSHEILIRSFQLAFSLRSISLQGGPLQPSRRRSLFTLAISMILFLSEAYNFCPLVTSAKAALSDKTIDLFLQLVDDCKLQAADGKTEINHMKKVYGSKEDDDDAMKSLAAIELVESSIIKEKLLKDFLPDDVHPLGAQLVTENPGQIYQFGLKESSPEVSETTKEVVRLSVSTPSDLPFKDMANQCESLQIAKQQVMSNITSAQLFQEISATFTSQAPSSEIVAMPCSAEFQHHLDFLPFAGFKSI